MNARIALTKPADVDVSVTLTMPLKDWKAMREAIVDRRYHALSTLLSTIIDDLVAMAETHFEATAHSEPPADAA